MKLSTNHKIIAGVVAAAGAYLIYSFVSEKKAKADPNKNVLPAGGTGAIPASFKTGASTSTDAAVTSGGAMTTLEVQHNLNAMGATPALKEDGKMGPLTKAAIVSFQTRVGIGADGIVGPITVAAIRKAMAAAGVAAAQQQTAQNQPVTRGQAADSGGTIADWINARV
jgi:peptidoglycan hydrolase-like protein with peptidoglycan-binding domain